MMKFDRSRRCSTACIRFVLSFALLLAGALPVRADSDDHDRARQALESGEILPLNIVLERVNLDTPGRVLEVELERKDERWVYEIKLLRQGGSVVKLRADASNGMVIPRHGHGEHGDPREH